MKSILLFGLALSINANAAVCGTWVVCGTYQKDDDRITDRKVIRELLVQEGSTPQNLIIEFATIDGGRRVTSRAELNFKDDGSYSAGRNGEIGSSGICKNKVCTLSVSPREFENETIAETAVFRYPGKSVEFYKFVVHGSGEAKSTVMTFKLAH